jgi:uncharacterized membrane protein
MRFQVIHRLFNAGLVLKGTNAVLETLSGLLIAVAGIGNVKAFVEKIAASELLDDPNDLFGMGLMKFAESFSLDSQHFYAFFLLSHGLVKLLIVYGLARGIYWAYPFSLAAITGFIIYQSYRVSHTHSIGLALFTLFDCVFIVLLWQEYKMARKRMRAIA